MDYVEVSKLNKIRDEENIPGNFISIEGEYSLNDGRKGFYKKDGRLIGLKNTSDHEYFTSKFLKALDIPCAEILLVREPDLNGCISVNILKENEEFVVPKDEIGETINSVRDFFKDDENILSTLGKLPSKFLKERKDYLVKYLMTSILIGNPDLKFDERYPIKNVVTEEYRNPEYLDMGIAFSNLPDRGYYFNFLSDKTLIDQLFELYPNESYTYSQSLVEKLDKLDLNDVEFADTLDYIKQNAIEKINNFRELVEPNLEKKSKSNNHHITLKKIKEMISKMIRRNNK